MRILYFSSDYTTHDRRFLTKMAESRHDIFFARLRATRSSYELRDLPARVQAVEWEGLAGDATPEACLAGMPRFFRMLKNLAPDLVHAGPIPTCAFMAALAGVRPLMSMSWGSDMLVDAHANELLGFTARFALERSDRFVIDCGAVRETIQAMTGAGTDRFVTFPWGLELARFPRRSVRAPGAELTILSTRSFLPIYDVETAVKAFAIAQRRTARRLRLVLVGDGPLAPRIDDAIDRLGIRESVTRTGRLPEDVLSERFASADVYLSCARSDGTSVSLLEAMANGLPVVVTDAPGNREWVTPGQGGWLAPAGDAEAFADRLVLATCLDDEPRARMARENRDLVERRADWHANTKALLAAYDQLAASR